VKIPRPPGELGLVNPFPVLAEDWKANEREWGWTVPTVDEIPDIGVALDLVRPFHPESGGMIIPAREAAAPTPRP
jgi:hypothetical protein